MAEPTKRRWVYLALLAFAAAILIWSLWPSNRKPINEYPSSILGPIVDPLPSLAEVQSITAIDVYDASRTKTYDIPKSLWPKLYAAMQPARRDYNPAPWEILFDLVINTKSGAQVKVCLYYVDDVGAFAIEHTRESRIYYRGGNSEALERVLRLAGAVLP